MSERNRRFGDIKFKLEQTLHFSESLPLLFVSNAKVACSTIKKSIWTSSSPETFLENSSPHDRVSGPFENNLHTARRNRRDLRSMTKFGLARNPYTRFISAYNDKILRPNPDPRVWKILCDRYGFKKNPLPSMVDVLKCIIADDELQVDQHFAKQKNNLSIGLIDYDFIGQLENFQEVQFFLESQDIQVSPHIKHSTGAGKLSSVKSVLEDDVIELIQEAYEDDFIAFCYDYSPANTAPVSAVKCEKIDEAILEHLVFLATSGNSDAFSAGKAELGKLTQNLEYSILFS